MMSEDQVLELLEIYMEMTEKQDEVIARLSRLVAKQATDLAHLRNIMRADISFDIQREADQVLKEYEDMKAEP